MKRDCHPYQIAMTHKFFVENNSMLLLASYVFVSQRHHLELQNSVDLTIVREASLMALMNQT